MKAKLLLVSAIMLAGLTVSTPVSADTTRQEIETQGNQKINSLWSEYQQALQERQNAWEQGKGDRYSDAYMTADAKAGAIYQEWLRAQPQQVTATQTSQTSSDQPQAETTKTDQPQTKASAVQSNQPLNVESKSITHSPQQATTSQVSDKPANLSSQVKKPAQSNTVQNDQQTKLPQTGNSNLLTAVGTLLIAFWGALIGVWDRF